MAANSIKVFRDTPSGSELVGEIRHQRSRFAQFTYEKSYVLRARAKGETGISERLPLSEEPYQSEEFSPFFQGLLPEGEILGNLAGAYQVARNDHLSLIDHLGCESIGSLTFLSESTPAEEFVARYEPLHRADIDEAKGSPLRHATRTAIETRLSLSGAQSKVAWFLAEGKSPEEASINDWLIPKGTAPSSHIIKMSRRGEEDLALNELACSILAETCGLETAKVCLVPEIPGAIAITRYDRQWVGSGCDRRLLRLHQEDFCQALGLSPVFKYQPEGVDADYIVYATDLLGDTTSNPSAARREFAKRLVFNYIVGNSDAHLKNSSLLYDSDWKTRRLAPVYDVTCIPLSGYSTKMPFDIGEHRFLDNIDERDIMSISLDAGVNLNEFDADVRDLVSRIESINLSAFDAATRSMISQILDNASPRMDVLRAFSKG